MEIPTPFELRQIRKRLHLTQQELAKKANLTQSFIAKLEVGAVDPRLSTFMKVVNVLRELEKGQKYVEDIMVSDVKYVDVEDTIDTAIEIMQKHGFSQLPVVKYLAPVGGITEKDILKKIESSPDPKIIKRTPVSEVMEDTFPVVTKKTNLVLCTHLLEFYPAVLVMEKGKLVGIVTRSDLLAFYESKKNRP